MDSLSYSIGVLFGNTLKQQGFDKLSAPDIVEALEEILSGKTTKISVQQASQIYSEAASSNSSKIHGKVKEEGEAYLMANAKRPGVTSLPNGLQYEVITMGSGPKPKVTDKVKTHYHGTLINGQVFDSSVDRGEPISFPLNGVIKGWTEGLQLMPVGSKWRLFIPYQLAYGERGAGEQIQPFSALVFEVELLGIE
ncbi:MAG: FKBP-type peptidyl-prolyl cis-trans isomerase [Bacteroidota bacterium]|nr:FKBP-type peptidyl-prolyl cis-trans isomerase [Bacteroidota bacterium]